MNSHNLVTRDYLDAKLDAKIAEMRGEVKDLRTELKGDIAALDTKIVAQETRVIKWMAGLYLGGLAFLSGFIYFLLKAFLPQV